MSDDYDAYTNRTFTVTDGEVSAYSGTHDLDSGTPGNPKVDDKAPYIRLFPYADTTNPGGVYIMAICSLEDGYPVDPRDCKYDAFKVKKGKLPYQFMLSGMKFEDLYADGVKDATDPGLPGLGRSRSRARDPTASPSMCLWLREQAATGSGSHPNTGLRAATRPNKSISRFAKCCNPTGINPTRHRPATPWTLHRSCPALTSSMTWTSVTGSRST